MVGVVACTEPSVAREMEEMVERGVLVASPSSAVGGRAGSGRLSGGSPGGGEVVTGLKTPASVLRREVGGGGVGSGGGEGGMQSTVRRPQRQVSILDYISGLYNK